ncbi:MAG: YdcF family protein [Candidatus Marsarchaeota archaeon]|jgi:uncharacterized SAM-binding protein YcdF (DUF218 family)|nr:YdcF family protein [Candidatus Marsarchaeota archaeon]
MRARPKDTIAIALGKGNFADGSLTRESELNTKRAAELYSTGKVSRILFSSLYSFRVARPPKLTEAEGMRRMAAAMRIPTKAMLKEERSLDTTGNAMFCYRIIAHMHEIRRILLVTNSYHLPRALYIFRKVFGPKYKITPISSGTSKHGKELRDARLHERAALALLKKIYLKLKSGDSASIRTTFMRNHPVYGSNPSTVPDFIWKSFSANGVSKEWLISNYMRRNARANRKRVRGPVISS